MTMKPTVEVIHIVDEEEGISWKMLEASRSLEK